MQPTKSHENNVVIVFFFMFTWKGNEMSLSHAVRKVGLPCRVAWIGRWPFYPNLPWITFPHIVYRTLGVFRLRPTPLCHLQASPWLRCSLKSLLQLSHSIVVVLLTGALWTTLLYEALSLSVSSGERFSLAGLRVVALEISFLEMAFQILVRSKSRSSSSILRLSSCNFKRCSFTRVSISRLFCIIICRLFLIMHFWTIWCIRRLIYFVLNPHPSHWTNLKSHCSRCKERSLRRTFFLQPILMQSVKDNWQWLVKWSSRPPSNSTVSQPFGQLIFKLS